MSRNAVEHDESELCLRMDEGGIHRPVNLPTESGHTVVAFSSGRGDGSYATRIGYAQDGEPARVATCFRLLAHIRL